jgi:hypothetical protein
MATNISRRTPLIERRRQLSSEPRLVLKRLLPSFHACNYERNLNFIDALAGKLPRPKPNRKCLGDVCFCGKQKGNFDHPRLAAMAPIQVTEWGSFGSKIEPCSLDVISSSTPLPYHFLTGSIIRGNVLGALWMDNAPVKLLTTTHTVVGEEATTASDRCLPSDRRCSAPKSKP